MGPFSFKCGNAHEGRVSRTVCHIFLFEIMVKVAVAKISRMHVHTAVGKMAAFLSLGHALYM